MADDVLRAGQLIRRDLGEVRYVSPEPTGARARAGEAGDWLSRRSIRREPGDLRDEVIDERLRRLGVGRR